MHSPTSSVAGCPHTMDAFPACSTRTLHTRRMATRAQYTGREYPTATRLGPWPPLLFLARRRQPKWQQPTKGTDPPARSPLTVMEGWSAKVPYQDVVDKYTQNPRARGEDVPNIRSHAPSGGRYPYFLAVTLPCPGQTPSKCLPLHPGGPPPLPTSHCAYQISIFSRGQKLQACLAHLRSVRHPDPRPAETAEVRRSSQGCSRPRPRAREPMLGSQPNASCTCNKVSIMIYHGQIARTSRQAPLAGMGGRGGPKHQNRRLQRPRV